MRSINARVIASVSFVLAVFIVLTGATLDRAFRESARSARQDRLLGQLYLLIAAAEVEPDGTLSMPPALSEGRFALPGSGLYAYITDRNGTVLWRSPSALGHPAPYYPTLAAGEKRFDERTGAGELRFFLHGLGVKWLAGGQKAHAFTFSVAEDLDEYRKQIRRYRESLWGWLGGMAGLLLLVQAAVLRWGLRPLRQVAAELAAIEAGRRERLEGNYPPEIKRLTDDLNALLQHERARQKRYRDALADLAHSLKTPLAVMRGALTEDPLRPSLVEEEVAKMDRIVDYQLQRAAMAGASSRLATPVAVGRVAAKIAASLRKVYHDKAPDIELQIGEDVVFRGDEGDLTELLGNLLDNACKWCRRRVRISAGGRAGLALAVEDDGPGIAEGETAHVLQRGARTDPATPGHGIGLAVVRDIVEAYGGTIRIGRSDLGGAAVRLEFPRI
jgi:two-component system sensor histidine kinase PhoQ